MKVEQNGNVAEYNGTTFESDNPSFALWLNTAFPAPTPEALLACGLTVDGVAPPTPEPEPAPEPLAEGDVVEIAGEPAVLSGSVTAEGEFEA